jgi:hypothetical protein
MNIIGENTMVKTISEISKPTDVKPAKVDKTFTVTQTTPLFEILTADKEGKLLVFDYDNFRTLAEDVWKDLSAQNVKSYMITQSAVKKSGESLDNPPIEMFKINPERATATAQIKVEGRDPKFHYAYRRPDELAQVRAEGGVVVKDKDIIAFNKQGSTPIVGLLGKPELVLVKTPVEIYESNRRRCEDESRRLDGNVIPDAEEAIKQQGFQTVGGN